jgi:MFS family permease
MAESYIRDALSLEHVANLSRAFAAFNLAYAAFEVPTGWLGDVFGPRATLIRVVLWWSFFTAVTAFVGVIPAFGLTTLIAVRFLFGMGEAGAFPNITRALHNWFPVGERGMAQGWVWMSARLMGGLTPLVWTALVVWSGWSWRSAFVIFGAVGVLWCIAFASWFRNRPEEVRAANDAERTLIRGDDAAATASAEMRVPWLKLLKSGNLWALCTMYFLMSYGWYFNLNYLPAYIEQMHGVSKDSMLGAIYKGGPLILGALGCVLGGWLTERFIQNTHNRRWGRRAFGMIGHACCIPLYFVCLAAPNAWLFALALALTGFFNDLAIGSAWACCQDIGRRHAAIVAGCMNTIGNLGGFVSALLIGRLLQLSVDQYLARAGLPLDSFKSLSPEAQQAALLPGYEWNFISFALVYAAAVFLWLRIDATKPVLPEDA